jgi:hypothetical protein
VQSEAFQAMGSPNLQGHIAHLQQHAQAKQQKAMMMQQQAMMAQQGQQGGPQAVGASQQQPTANNVAQLQGVGQMGAMGDISQSPAASNGSGPSNLSEIGA